MSHDWICNTLILHRLKEIAIQNKEWINLGNDDLMHMKEETQWLYMQVYINYDFVSLNKFHSSLIYHGFLKISHFFNLHKLYFRIV